MTKIMYHGREQCTANTFCLLTGRGDNDSLDYGYQNPALGWTKSSQDGNNHWFDDGAIRKDDIPILLAKFGLEDVVDARLANFETVRYLSPAKLINIRRDYERDHNLERLEVISDRVGGRVPADILAD